MHVPASDDSGKVRLIQFRHPDGFDAIPFFTSWEKARAASSASVRILTLAGRDLLAGTLGATLMLNPNDGGAVLYPEEIKALLETGAMARIEKVSMSGMDVRPVTYTPGWLIPALCTCLEQADFVFSAYILESRSMTDSEHMEGLLICLVANPAYAERAARLVTSALQPLASEADPIIDIVVHDASAPLPEYVTSLHIIPIFDRSGRR